ncbi:MAG: cupin domain-containing protein [Akkermansiaceae bacterium]
MMNGGDDIVMRPTEMIEHPEGGRFKEVFRSGERVVRLGDGSERDALTHIYFSLRAGEVSKFHKVTSDEVWNLYRGDGIRLYLWDGSSEEPRVVELSEGEGVYCCVVPAGVWQAAEPVCDGDGEEVLVGCSVGPGFEFEDFELIDGGGEVAGLLGEEWVRFV